VKWYARITGLNARKTVAQTCSAAGVDVVPRVTVPVRPPPKPDAGIDKCTVNPMNCQR